MRKESLVLLNAMAATTAMGIIFLSWFYLPHETFAWGVILAYLVIALALYLDVKYVIAGLVEARRKASGKPVPGPKKPWLTMLNYAGVIVILAFLVLYWFYLPHETFFWGVLLALVIFLSVCLVNWWDLAVDYIDAGKPVKVR